MLPSRSSNESSFVDLVGSLSNSLNSTTSSSKGNNFIELNENDFKTHLSSEQQGCFQPGDGALGSIESSQIFSNPSDSQGPAVFGRTEPNVFVNQSELAKPTGALHNEHFKLIDLGDDKDYNVNRKENSFDRFDCIFESEQPQRPDNQRSNDSAKPSVQLTRKDRNLILPNRTLDYWPAGRSDSSESGSSNLTDENSNEFDSFLKSADSQTKYYNRTKKMSYKIKGVLMIL